MINWVPEWAAKCLPFRLRYGHAFPSLAARDDPIEALLDLIKQGKPIGSRDPTDPHSVSAAELALGLSASERPVYAYVGNLHPALGRVGLIISSSWYLRSPLGVSRCDTGGLVGLKGGFSCVASEGEAIQMLRALTHDRKIRWGIRFRKEIFTCYGKLAGWGNYLGGKAPVNNLNDHRDTFIRRMSASGASLDRRLWTWEARAASPIKKSDVVAVALSPEAMKHIVDDCRRDPNAYGAIEFLAGSATSGGVNFFDEVNVVRTFMGLRCV